MKFSWHWFRLSRAAWRSVTVLVILLVFYVFAGRQLMPLLDRTVPNITQYLSEQLDQPVEFQSIQGYWSGLRPTLIFEGVRIADELSVERVVVEPVFLASLIHQQPRFSRLELDGIHIDLVEVEGVWKIPSLTAFANRPWHESLALLTGEGVGIDAINLRDITLSLRGQTETLNVHIRDGVWLSDRDQQQLRGVAWIEGAQTEAQADLQLDIVQIDQQQHIFLNLNHSLFDYLSIPTELRSLIPWQPDSLVLAAHSRWHWQQGQLQAVQLEVSEGEGAWQSSDQSQLEFEAVSFNLSWQRRDRFQLQLRDLSFQQNLLAWSASDFDVTWAEDGVNIMASRIDLAPLVQFTEITAGLGFLTDLQPQGLVNHLALHLPRSEQGWTWSDLVATGTLEAVQVNRHLWLPGLKGLNGEFLVKEGRGLLNVLPSELEVDLPDLLPESIQMGLSEGLIGWSITQSGRLHITSSELDFSWRDSGRVRGRFNFAGAWGEGNSDLVEPVFALALSGDTLGVASLQSAIPLMTPEGIQQWLSSQLNVLEVDAWSIALPNVLSRDLKPRLGLMNASIAQAQIGVGEQWPDYSVADAEFSLDHQGLRAVIADSNYGELAVAQARVILPFDGRNELHISGMAAGRTEDAMQIVRETPIQSRLHPQILNMELKGSLAGNIDLRIPLLGDPLKMDLDLIIRDTEAFWPTFDLLVEDLNGPMSISLTEGVRSSGLQGRFLGSPIAASMASQSLDQGGWRVELPIEGVVHSEALLEWLDQPSLLTGNGASLPFAGQLVFSPMQSGLELVSDASGLLAELSLPMTPRTEELSLKLDFEPDARAILFSWPGVIVADIRTFLDGYPMNGHIALGDAQPQLRPERGVWVELQSESLSVASWQSFLQRQFQPTDDWHEQPQAWRSFLSTMKQWHVTRLDVMVDAVSDLPLLENGFELQLQREDRAWQSQFSMARARGAIWLPDAAEQSARLSLQQLVLGEAEPDARETSDSIAPQDRVYPQYDPKQDALAAIRAHWFPSTAITAQDVILNGQSTGPWSVQMLAHPESLEFKDIRGVWRTVQVTGDLLWQTPETGWHDTQARLVLSADNMADVLLASKLSPVVVTRRAAAEVDLTWPGSIAASDRYRWQGDVRFNLYDGSILDLDDLDAVRLIGLLNVTRIVRRLSLDFQDVLGAGISFDRVRGHLLFDDGLVSVGERLTLQGSGARMFFVGDYQMLRDQLDAEGVMVARVSNAAGLLAIGAGFAPPVALAIILGERAFEREIERLFSVRMRISGSLANPVVDSRRLFDGDIRGADTTFEERLRELFGPDQRSD